MRVATVTVHGKGGFAGLLYEVLQTGRLVLGDWVVHLGRDFIPEVGDRGPDWVDLKWRTPPTVEADWLPDPAITRVRVHKPQPNGTCEVVLTVAHFLEVRVICLSGTSPPR